MSTEQLADNLKVAAVATEGLKIKQNDASGLIIDNLSTMSSETLKTYIQF